MMFASALQCSQYDAKKIAGYARDRWAELRQHTPMDTIRYQLKPLNRRCGLYTKTKTMMKNNLIALLEQPYPGVNTLFGSPVREDGTQKWVDFTASFWHVDCVRGMSQSLLCSVRLGQVEPLGAQGVRVTKQFESAVS